MWPTKPTVLRKCLIKWKYTILWWSKIYVYILPSTEQWLNRADKNLMQLCEWPTACSFYQSTSNLVAFRLTLHHETSDLKTWEQQQLQMVDCCSSFQAKESKRVASLFIFAFKSFGILGHRQSHIMELYGKDGPLLRHSQWLIIWAHKPCTWIWLPSSPQRSIFMTNNPISSMDSKNQSKA